MVGMIQLSLIVVMMLSVILIVINIPKRTMQLQRVNKTDAFINCEQKTHDYL